MRSFLLKRIIVSILSIKSIPTGAPMPDWMRGMVGILASLGRVGVHPSPTAAADAELQISKEIYFDRLCAVLALSPSAGGPRCAAAHSGAVRVFLEHDGEQCFFSLGPSAIDEPVCPVEALTERFREAGRIGADESDATLAGQALFIERHWSDLQRMFSPQGLAETGAWIAIRKAAIVALYAREN